MIFTKAKKSKEQGPKNAEAPEKTRYSRYYEHDGQLRAYANRAMLLAFLSIPTALVAVSLAAYVRLQPPTVIRVDPNGEASLVGQGSQSKVPMPISVSQGTGSEASDFEQKAFIRLFLDRYLNFSPDTVNRNWADGVNMMTANLRRVVLSQMEKDNTVGRVQDDQITSVFHLRSIEAAKDDSLAFTVFGVKDIHRVHDHRESTEELVTRYRIRLITERRSETNPSGLLLAEYSEKLIDGENRDAAAQQTPFGGSN